LISKSVFYYVYLLFPLNAPRPPPSWRPVQRSPEESHTKIVVFQLIIRFKESRSMSAKFVRFAVMSENVSPFLYLSRTK